MSGEPPDRTAPFNREAAWAHVEGLPPGPLRDFLSLALAAATERLLRPDGMSEREFEAQLPAAPVDLLFLVRAVEDVAAHPARFRDLLEPDAR